MRKTILLHCDCCNIGLESESINPLERRLAGLCCANPWGDSSRESSMVAGRHEQTYPPDLQDQELAGLQ